MAKKTALQKHRAEGYAAASLDRQPGERWVTMSNALTRAAHGLTLGEKRIIAWAVATLDSRRVLPHGEVHTTRILVSDYAEQFGIDPDTGYSQLRIAAKQLFNRYITFYEPAYKRRGKPIEPTQIQMHWVGRATYHKGEGWVELAWWHELLPHLTGLRKQFTSYQLQQASALRSIYSWRLLELLTRFKSTGMAEYTIEDFRASMEAPASLSDFGQVKRRIIDPAVKELTEKDGWLIQWEAVKAGRKVKAVRFTFMRDPQGRLL